MRRPRLQLRLVVPMILIALGAIPMAYYAELAKEKERQRAKLQNYYYLLYQPYTLKSNGPKGTNAWALGISVPLPIYNRNRGAIPPTRSQRPAP